MRDFLLTLRWKDIVNLQLDFAPFVGVFLYGITNVEGTLGFYKPCLRALSKSNTVHHIVALVVNQFELDVFLSTTDNLARTVVVDFLRTKLGFHIARSERRKLTQLLVEAEGHVLEVNHGINVQAGFGLFVEYMFGYIFLEATRKFLYVFNR